MIVALAEIEALQARLDAILAEAGRVDEERRRQQQSFSSQALSPSGSWMQLLGHQSIATTERYCAVDDSEIRATMEAAGL
jgi:hypothetical protein